MFYFVFVFHVHVTVIWTNRGRLHRQNFVGKLDTKPCDRNHQTYGRYRQSGKAVERHDPPTRPLSMQAVSFSFDLSE